MGVAESRMGFKGLSSSSSFSSQQAGLILSKLDGKAGSAVDASFLETLLADKELQGSAASYALAVAAIVFTGGVAAPVVEEKLGLGGECREAAGAAASLGAARGQLAVHAEDCVSPSCMCLG
jgi:hypothetical protein